MEEINKLTIMPAISPVELARSLRSSLTSTDYQYVRSLSERETSARNKYFSGKKDNSKKNKNKNQNFNKGSDTPKKLDIAA